LKKRQRRGKMPGKSQQKLLSKTGPGKHEGDFEEAKSKISGAKGGDYRRRGAAAYLQKNRKEGKRRRGWEGGGNRASQEKQKGPKKMTN